MFRLLAPVKHRLFYFSVQLCSFRGGKGVSGQAGVLSPGPSPELPPATGCFLSSLLWGIGRPSGRKGVGFPGQSARPRTSPRPVLPTGSLPTGGGGQSDREKEGLHAQHWAPPREMLGKCMLPAFPSSFLEFPIQPSLPSSGPEGMAQGGPLVLAPGECCVACRNHLQMPRRAEGVTRVLENLAVQDGPGRREWGARGKARTDGSKGEI